MKRKLHHREHSKQGAMHADTGGSTAFDSLTYKRGEVRAVFTDGTFEIYDVDRDTAKEWFSDSSLGGFFNRVIREPTK